MQKWLRKLKLKLATLIWKVTDSQKIDFCVQSANFNFNFLSHFCINSQYSCAHYQEEILRPYLASRATIVKMLKCLFQDKVDGY